MPSSAVRTFTDPDDYATAIRATRAELTVKGRGDFNAKLTRIDLHHLWMQRFSDNLPRVLHSAAVTGRAFIIFRTQPGPNLLWGGRETARGDPDALASRIVAALVEAGYGIVPANGIEDTALAVGKSGRARCDLFART
jgi:hypothetical protein